MTTSPEQYLSITELTTRFNDSIQAAFPLVSFKGEISQCTQASSGHLYFTIKDEKSQLSAVMWRGVATKLTFVPKQGMEVHCQGKPNIYSGTGKFQVVVSRMEEAGEGLLQKRFLELKSKLEKEGLFDPSRKRPLPFLPRKIGVVTSKSGAAIHDIMTKILERMPIVPVVLYDSRVQGEGAAEEIARGIQYFQRDKDIDVVIIGRGGGSLEDLWSFNEEVVVRAVFASSIPIISAVGHEVDISLSDLAADVRAPTPTAAGEMVVPRREDLLTNLERFERSLRNFDLWFYPFSQRVDDFESRLSRSVQIRIEQSRSKLEKLRADLGTIRPDRYLAQLAGTVEERARKLRDAVQRRLRGLDDRSLQLDRRLRKFDPEQLLKSAREQVVFTERRLRQGVAVSVREQKQRLREYYKMLQALNFEKVLHRGFSLVSAEGKFIRSADELHDGQMIDIRFAKGGTKAEVKSGVIDKPKSAGGKKGVNGSSKQGALFSS